jgi:Domain of unknown function (DUF397)
MSEPNRSNPTSWRKSSASLSGECVEVAGKGEEVAVRDSKDRDGPQLTFSARTWRDFLMATHEGN